MSIRAAVSFAILYSVLPACSGRAQNMALTPDERLSPRPPSLTVPHRGWPMPPPRPRAFEGKLPNQGTGPMNERVLRDICIGCDR